MLIGAPSRRLENELDGLDVSPPTVGLGTHGSPARCREVIVLSAAVVLGGAPVAVDPAALLEALQRGIERALVHVEHSAGELLDARADSPAVHRLEGQRLEDQ